MENFEGGLALYTSGSGAQNSPIVWNQINYSSIIPAMLVLVPPSPPTNSKSLATLLSKPASVSVLTNGAYNLM
jgi:hypothetical protein